jgi:O-antigen ligase
MLNPQEIFPVSSKPIHKALVVLLGIVAFALPFKDYFLVNPFIVCTIIVWLISNPFKELFSLKKGAAALMAISFFYLLHVCSFAYTKNLQESFINLETKISLLAFPLIFYTANYSSKQGKFFLRNFIAGCLLCCVGCISHSAYISISENKNYFFYQDLSWFQHPSYLSMYLTFCCMVLFHEKLYTKTVRTVLAVFFTIFVMMLSSKSGIAIHVIFLGVWFILDYTSSGSYKKLALFSGIFILIIVGVVFFVPQIKSRFDNLIGAFQSENIDKTVTESTAVRKLIWHEAAGIIKEKPLLGTSPGDANTTLYERYNQNGLTGAYTKKLNAHNEYLQTGVGLGIIGMLSLACIFLLPLFSNKNKLFVFFLLITSINFVTESMLQTMAGCIFFGYFYAMLCFQKPEPNLKN